MITGVRVPERVEEMICTPIESERQHRTTNEDEGQEQLTDSTFVHESPVVGNT